MKVDEESTNTRGTSLGRRSVLLGALGAGAAVAMLPGRAQAAPSGPPRVAGASAAGPVSPGSASRVPPVLRSRQALTGSVAKAGGLPMTKGGTTYNLAQEVRWLDASHFAVGRWDGTMSVYEFETAPYVGPVVSAAVNSPSSNGVQMITSLPRCTIVTSNDACSLAVWAAPRGHWGELELRCTVPYDPALGVATNGVFFGGRLCLLVVGHDSGCLSVWSFNPERRSLRCLRTVDVRAAHPVNPWGSHVLYGLSALASMGTSATVVAGSDDGCLSVVEVPSGRILSQRMYNDTAQRGINSVAVCGDQVLVSNCSVGAADHNLWLFRVDMATCELVRLDCMNLIADTSRVQSYNFDTVFGATAAGPCWFAGTEEGILWMGTADTKLCLTGCENLCDGTFGAALDYTGGPGRLAAVIHDLDQYCTGAA
jgi:hypothetical protein